MYNDNIDLNNLLQQNKNTIDSLKTENENLKNKISNQEIDLNKKINNKQAYIDSLNNMLKIQKQKNNKLDEIKTCKDNRLNVYTRRYMLWKEIEAIQTKQTTILKEIASCNLFQNKYKKKLENEVEKLNREITNAKQKLSDNNKVMNTYYGDDVNLQNDLKKLNEYIKKFQKL